MIPLDATVNGKPTSLLLDTGANSSIISPKPAGLTAVQLRALQAAQAGTGAEGDAVIREIDLRRAGRHSMNRRVLIMKLDAASNRMGMQVCGFFGQDILREFSSVRIDHKRG